MGGSGVQPAVQIFASGMGGGGGGGKEPLKQIKRQGVEEGE